MIKDYALRYFIFKSFIKNIDRDIQEVSSIIFNKLSRKFLKNEEIIVNRIINNNDNININRYNNNKFNNNYKEGLIIKIINDKYYVMIKKDNLLILLNNTDLIRRDLVDRRNITNFIAYITYESKFGVRLMKKNIYKFVSDQSSIKGYKKELIKLDYNFKENYIKKEDIFNSINYNKEDIINKEDNNYNKEDIINKEDNNYKNEDIINKEDILNKEDIINKNDIINKEDNNNNNNNNNIIYDIPTSEIFEISNLDFKNVNRILRIYSFIYNFCPNKIFTNVSILKLLRNFKEQTYISDIIGIIHGFLIENLLEEKKNIGFDNFLLNIKSVMDSISEDFKSDDIIIGNEVGMRGWKLKSRNLLLEMYKNTKNKTILTFYNVLNKKSPFNNEETILLRIKLVEFFINCYMATNIFRDIILNEIKKVKLYEQKCSDVEKLINNKDYFYKEHNKDFINNIKKEHNKDFINNNLDVNKINEYKKKINELKKKIVKSPAKSEIGQINNAKFFLVGQKVFISKNLIFYVPSKNTLEVILQKYNPTDKAEITTVQNLKLIIEYLY